MKELEIVITDLEKELDDDFLVIETMIRNGLTLIEARHYGVAVDTLRVIQRKILAIHKKWKSLIESLKELQ